MINERRAFEVYGELKNGLEKLLKLEVIVIMVNENVHIID